MFQGRNAAFTLIELVWVLAIMAVMFNVSLGFTGLVEKERRYQAQLELRRLVSYTRSEAVSRGEQVTLCALNSTRRCTGEWSGRSVAVFVDRDRDGRAADQELLRLASWDAERGVLQWRAALGRPQLAFSPFGSTYQNGSFYLCRERGKVADLVLTVNRGGRPYLAKVAGRRCR